MHRTGHALSGRMDANGAALLPCCRFAASAAPPLWAGFVAASSANLPLLHVKSNKPVKRTFDRNKLTARTNIQNIQTVAKEKRDTEL